MSTYDVLRYFAAAWGSAYFAVIFGIALVWVLLPSNSDTYEAAARIPLDKD